MGNISSFPYIKEGNWILMFHPCDCSRLKLYKGNTATITSFSGCFMNIALVSFPAVKNAWNQTKIFQVNLKQNVEFQPSSKVFWFFDSLNFFFLFFYRIFLKNPYLPSSNLQVQQGYSIHEGLFKTNRSSAKNIEILWVSNVIYLGSFLMPRESKGHILHKVYIINKL